MIKDEGVEKEAIYFYIRIIALYGIVQSIALRVNK